jgi:TorA maturation chaperone TorD
VPEVVALQEHQDRADVYALLAALLLGPDARLIATLATLPRASDVEDDDRALAWNALLQSASRGSGVVLAEYQALFGAGGRALRPCRCSYREGLRGAPPPARLRENLRQLGLVRAPGVTEPEDHLGALCETMRVLIERGHPLDVQRHFFRRHLAGWCTRCLQDIAAAPGADFYRALAAFAQTFFEREARAVAASA